MTFVNFPSQLGRGRGRTAPVRWQLRRRCWNLSDLDNHNLGPIVSITAEHELGHQFLGDPFRPRTAESNFGRDYEIDTRNTLQGMGVSQGASGEGLEPRRYAAPASPEANKPQK